MNAHASHLVIRCGLTLDRMFTRGLQRSTPRQNAGVGSSSTVSWAKMQLSMLDGLRLRSRRRVLSTVADRGARNRPLVNTRPSVASLRLHLLISGCEPSQGCNGVPNEAPTRACGARSYGNL